MPEAPVAGFCASCHRPVRPMQAGSFVEVIAWHRADSSSVLKGKRTTGRVLCAGCQPGEVVGQGELLFDV